MIALGVTIFSAILFAMLVEVFCRKLDRIRLEECEREMDRFTIRVERNLAHRKAQRQVRSERAKRGWNTRRAV